MWSRERGWRRLAGAAAALASVGAFLGPAVSPAHADVTGAPASSQSVSVQVSATPTGEPLPAGFLGFSVEYGALHAYLGRDPAHLNPVFLQLLEGIDQGHLPILRVGGNSSDDTWLPLPGVIPPPAIGYSLTPDWLSTVRALVRRTGTRLILGVNLAADDPQTATAEASALIQGIGANAIQALEIGNEPDLYLTHPWYHDPDGTSVTRRAGGYSYRTWTVNLAHWSALVPRLPIAAGAFATLAWLPKLVPTATRFARVSTVTAHRYALTNCGVAPTSPLYPTIANLLSPAATSGLAAPLAPDAQTLHSEGINLRIDELNTASCEGAPGVSDTFASALWMVDELFDMAAAGVDGVNIHTLPGAAYAPFSFHQSGGAWSATVAPLYYGMLFFAQAFPPGASLLAASDSSADNGGDVKAFTTETPDGTLRTTVINEDASSPAAVALTLPTQAPLNVESLTAPALDATSGVALGGRSFTDPTSTGVLGAPASSGQVLATNGTYDVDVAPGRAVLLTSG